MESTHGQEADPNVRMMEAKLSETLSPMEPLLMKAQSLLVWENPRRSLLMIACVHGLFWFLATTSYRVYFMVSMVAMVVFFIDIWKKKIWPEIRVPPSPSEDQDGWTPIHPRLLSVPEICQHLAEAWVWCSGLFYSWITMRKDRPLPFCLMNCGVCSVLAMISHYVPGLMLSYILVISLLLWPCIVYHNLLQKIYLQGEPLFMRLDYCLKFRGRWPFKAKASVRAPRGQRSAPGQDHAEVDTDSDLEEFVPSADPLTTAALARAITDSEDEGGTPRSTPALLSKEPSVSDHNTDEENDKDSFRDFARGIEEMPSFEEVLDQTDDENEHMTLVTKPETKEKILSSSRNASKESTPVDGRMDPMHFVPSHFRDSDSEEENTLTRQLSFPDIAEVSETESTYSGSSSSLVSAVASSVMQQSLPSAVMSAALSGLNRLGGSLHSTVQPEPVREPLKQQNVGFSLGSGDEEDSGQVRFPPASHQGAGDSEEDSDYSDDTEEADDFEFLDENELENYEKNK